MPEFAIEVEQLSKTYTLNYQLRKNLLEGLTPKSGRSKESKKIHGLKDVSFKVKKGEIVGIVGDNGSGKSTLLKILSNVTKPSSGNVRINGNLVGILEIGTGLHPELSGRENIYFSASLWGFSQKVIQKVEQQIIEFSGLNDFIDVQVKYYSSGMFMRLAFSIIANIDADILLLDEIFAVGDSSFRQKCEDHLEKLSKSGKTILLVSHDMSSISKICTYYLHLDNGYVIKESKEINVITDYISKQYEKKTDDREEASQKEPSYQLAKEEVKPYESVRAKDGSLTTFVKQVNPEYFEGELVVRCYTNTKDAQWNILNEIFLECEYTKKTSAFMAPVFALSYQVSNIVAAFTPFHGDQPIDESFFKQAESVKLKCSIPKNMLNAGYFSIQLFFTDENSTQLFVFKDVVSFVLSANKDYYKKIHYDGKFRGPFLPKSHWEIT